MSDTSKPLCPECGKPLPAHAPAGLCPRCLMALNMATQTVLTGDEADPHSAPKAPAPPPEEIARLFPNLEILECLGRGGMGVVYRARQKSLNRLVALKILAPERKKDTAFAHRFAVEAETLAKLNHPGIVTIYDFGQTEDLFYLVMEFVDGVTLRQLLNNSRISPREALAIVPQICDALQYAHDRGIVHRDIKPENILLGRDGHVKVADFGIAKMVGPDTMDKSPNPAGRADQSDQPAPVLTEAGKVLGTPQYMAPEQRENSTEVDHRADIYSLGVVLYQMLTGELPVGKFEPPSHKIQMDVRIDEVVLRALEKNPELRYQQASVLKTQVETIAATPSAAGQPAESNPGGLPKISLCYISTPEHLRTFKGRFFYIYQGKGELRLDNETLSFRSGWWKAVTIPLSSISTLAGGSYPSSAKPVPLHYIAVTFTESGLSRTLLFTPVRTELMSPIEANKISAEWRSALQETIRARTGRMLEIQRSVIGQDRFWLVKTFLLTALGCTAALALMSLIMDQRLPNVMSELIWGPIVPLITFALLLPLRWWWRRSAPPDQSDDGPPGSSHQQPSSLPGDAGPSKSNATLVYNKPAGWLKIAQWTARILGTICILFVLPFLFAEGLPPLATQPTGVQLTFLGAFLLLLGFIIGWWREGRAALLIAGGWTVIRMSESDFRITTPFEIVLVVAVLYALCWWATKGQKTARSVVATAVLVALLVLGRLLCPFNVFVSGTVTDTTTGMPVANAEFRLHPRPSRPPGEMDPPNTRSDKNGRFTLYVGRYVEGSPVAINALGFVTMVTNLNPRPLGQRRVNQNFELTASELPSGSPKAKNSNDDVTTGRISQPKDETELARQDTANDHGTAALDSRPDRSLVAEIAGGRFELLAVRHYPSSNNSSWWSPDGTPSTVPGVVHAAEYPAVPTDHQGIELLVTSVFPKNTGVANTRFYPAIGASQSNTFICHRTAPSGSLAMDVTFYVASGLWETIGRQDGQVRVNQDGGIDFIVQRFSEGAGDVEWRVVAVDREGVEHPSSGGVTFTSGFEAGKTLFIFGGPHAQSEDRALVVQNAREFRLQKRVGQALTFHSLSLRPGHKRQATVSIPPGLRKHQGPIAF